MKSRGADGGAAMVVLIRRRVRSMIRLVIAGNAFVFTRTPILDAQRQRCKVCGRFNKFDFHVPDEIWEEVVPERFVNRVVCLACFDEFARCKGVDYAQHLETLDFAGDRASFEFRVVSAVDC